MVVEEKDKNMINKSIGFEEFPNEILLKILSFLEILDLIKCSNTSKRIRSICYDDSLWQKIDLSKKKVTTGLIQKVIDSGCKRLNLYKAKIVATLRLKNYSQLTDLDLSGCSASSHVFEELLGSCHHLQKLTFTRPLEFNTLSSLTNQNGKTLQVLNCWWEYQDKSDKNIDLKSIQSIIENCTELKELNFWNGVANSGGENINYNCGIYGHGIVDYLVNNISPNIEKFSVQERGAEFRDEHIKILVSRCTKLKELRFSSLSITNASLTHIIDHLMSTLEKLELDNINIDEKEKLQLKVMPKLKSLICLGYRWEIEHNLREQLPDISVNGYPPMATVCKKKKVKYDKYFYNDICPEDPDFYFDSDSEYESDFDSESESKCELGKCTHERTFAHVQ